MASLAQIENRLDTMRGDLIKLLRVLGGGRRAAMEPERLSCGDATLDLAARRLELPGAMLLPTPKELELLRVFLGAPGRVFTRADLLRLVWEPNRLVSARVVDAHVRRLRRRLGSHRHRLLTVKGAGYGWEA